MLRKSLKFLLPLLTAVLLTAFGVLGAFAEDVPPEEGESSIAEVETEFVEPETEYIPPETEYAEPETEYIEPETEYVAPETEEQTTEETEAVVQPTTQSVQNEYIALVDDAQEPTNFIAPQMDKSVSNKTYSTDYTAGVISWICVGVGVIVVIVMLVSTKITGRRASQRRV